MKYFIGIDCGSVSLKAVLMNKNKKILKKAYEKNYGLISTIKKLLLQIKTNKQINGVGITGSGREFVSTLIGGDKIDSEIIAHYIATLNYYPDVKTIFDIGGEDSKLIMIEKGIIHNFMMNRDCGGGTGAMIETIANRMGISLDKVGEVALQSKNKINLPSKCGIFCQSAVVSKLNKGMNKSDILMGVCRGLIGNYFTVLAKGKTIKPPYVFQGATAKNRALIKCFEDELNHKIIVPKYPEFMGAIGIALLTMEEIKKSKFKDFGITNSNFETKTRICNGCDNHCEVTKIFQDKRNIGCIGNRCEKGLKEK